MDHGRSCPNLGGHCVVSLEGLHQEPPYLILLPYLQHSKLEMQHML
jgi:hypothetical protein